MTKIKKALEMTDVKIDFISVVDKAANGKNFLIAKDENGNKIKKMKFNVDNRIIKSEGLIDDIEVSEGSHIVVAPVYEPLEEDAHGNFMDPEEIQKAIEYFNANGSENSDIQHSETPVDSITVVKSWELEEDYIGEDYLGNEVVVKAGSWMAALEITDEEIFEAVEKAELTGLSMGGYGKYSTEDVDVDSITKSVAESFIDKISKVFSIQPVTKSFEDSYKANVKSSNFWQAFWTLEDELYNWWDEVYETDPAIIKQNLEEFSEAIQSLLAEDDISKALSLPVNKAGKSISKKNMESLESIKNTIDSLIDNNTEQDEDDEEEEEVNKSKDYSKIEKEYKILKDENEELKKSQKTEDELVESVVEKSMGLIAKNLGIELPKPESEMSLDDKIAKQLSERFTEVLGSNQIESTVQKSEEDNNQSPFAGLLTRQ